MESARQDQRKWECRRVAWAVTVVACASHAPWFAVRALTPMLAYGGWFLHLLDVQITGISERTRVPFTAGWLLLGAATASAIRAIDPSFLASVASEIALLALAARAWIDVRRM